MRTGPEAFMIEPIMYFGLGFLAAALIGLIIVPFVHGRAVRLTVRRLEAATPLSMAEIQADKDQLRAEFAMSTRRLEMSVDQLKNKSTGQLADLGKKNDVINRLKMELGEKAATIFALEARDRGIKDQLRATEDELAVKTGALRETERTLAEKESELTKYTAQFTATSATSDSQRIEIVSLKTQVENLKDQVAGLGKEVKETSDRYAREKEAGEKATKELAEERGNVTNLGTRLGGLERQLATQTTEAEIMGRRIADMEMRLTEQSRVLADRERERDQLRVDLESARRIETDLRQELGTLDRRHGTATEALRAEKQMAESQLERAREDRSKLQSELSAMKREAEATWASERVENALLRERINDVAAEVARLTSVLEGPGSEIDTILATEHTSGTNGANGAAKSAVTPANTNSDDKGSLADRIRALQARSSRLSSAT
jgi:predicted  nucleic acid-binding Zn-ribbon protein